MQLNHVACFGKQTFISFGCNVLSNDCKLCQNFIEHTEHTFEKSPESFSKLPTMPHPKLSSTISWFVLCLFMFIQPSNWSPDCLKYLQSVFVNANIRVLNSQEIIKYATTMSGSGSLAYLMRQWVLSTNCQLVNVMPSIEGANDSKPKCEMSDDEQHMLETLIR